ncbi:AAA family ATPase [Kribbella sp. NPDC059898]|uniref:AAA family ATPase n=1 Tax=Kribbella sp. NPDC059898 TaxID=3346995 RepID=UPI0036636D98
MLTTPSSETHPRRTERLVVAEGMPGAGKTTALQILESRGHVVLGEYTTPAGTTVPVGRHPSVEDDVSHQRNWLIKNAQARNARRQGQQPVWLDRDWLTSLAYAASLADHALLTHRATWAVQCLAAGELDIADTYVVLHVDPGTSLARRAARLNPGHVWAHQAALGLLARFYTDPVAAIAPAHRGLAQRLAAANWRHLHAPTITEAVAALEHEGLG